MTEASLFFVIVNRGSANRLLSKALGAGVSGGTIMLGEGTMQSSLFDLLGINQTHKEVLMMAVPDEAVDVVYSLMRNEFKLHKRFKGIAFSVPYRRWHPGKEIHPEGYAAYRELPPYVCLITIVDKGVGADCMVAARNAGARGGTIVHARGAGVPQDFYVPIMVEPQKDMVLIVASRNQAPNIREAVYREMQLDQPGKGIIFALPVLNTIGLYEERKQEAKA